MENDIRNVIVNTLKIIEVKSSQRLSTPCFMLNYGYLENGNVFGNGKCELSDHHVQIDLYYSKEKEDDFKVARNKVKNALIEKYVYPDMETYFDTSNNFYRATFQFVVQESEV